MKLRELVLSQLVGSIWHTTSWERYHSILSMDSISPEPPIPNSDRWSTKAGPRWYPFVRSIGGVSLFDFREFEAGEYDARYPLSNWREFVPARDNWNVAIWIEIDLAVGAPFVDPSTLLARWKENGGGRRIMPLIEAAYVGPIPLKSFGRVLEVSRLDQTARLL